MGGRNPFRSLWDFKEIAMFRQSKFKYWKRHESPNKYKANSGYCLSNHFHRSTLEKKTCDELRLCKIAGEIKDYRVEVNIHLELDGLNLGTYRADFVVENNDGTTEIVEAKGMQLPVFRQKWKILEHMIKDDPNVTMRMVTK
jgi:hypothetical protein